jgi:hypothetical protein
MPTKLVTIGQGSITKPMRRWEMRKIKFRAWHFKLNRMFSAEEMTQDQMALLPDGHFANIHGSDTNKSVIYPHTSMLPLQFTGLHDKNGKEIYEGDICRFDVREGGVGEPAYHGLVGQVGFSFGCYTIGDFLSHYHSLEVIGNIYENPELLEGNR